MNFTKLACASIAVASIDDALPTFTEGLGLKVLGPVQTSERGYGLRWIELGNDDGLMLELIEPTGETGPVSGFLEKPSVSRIYQVRLYTDDLEKALGDAEAAGVKVVRGPHVDGQPPIGWIHPASTGGALLEIMQVGGDER
jgi:methylmalonyl-CoA/ethylmalonyl-CoA epimerase